MVARGNNLVGNCHWKKSRSNVDIIRLFWSWAMGFMMALAELKKLIVFIEAERQTLNH